MVIITVKPRAQISIFRFITNHSCLQNCPISNNDTIKTCKRSFKLLNIVKVNLEIKSQYVVYIQTFPTFVYNTIIKDL